MKDAATDFGSTGVWPEEKGVTDLRNLTFGRAGLNQRPLGYEPTSGQTAATLPQKPQKLAHLEPGLSVVTGVFWRAFRTIPVQTGSLASSRIQVSSD